MTITLDSKTEANLRALAAQRQLSVEAYLAEMLSHDAQPFAAPGVDVTAKDESRPSGAMILEALQASPYPEIDLTPPRVPVVVRDVTF